MFIHSGKILQKLVLFAAVAVPALAGPLTWNLENVTSSDGAVFTGSFVFDADLLRYSAVHITSSGGTFTPSTTFTQAIFPLPAGAGYMIVVDTDESIFTGHTALAVNFAHLLTNGGGNIPLSTTFGGTCTGATCQSIIQNNQAFNLSGSVVAETGAPEPSTFALLLPLGLLLLRRQIAQIFGAVLEPRLRV